MVRVIKVSDDFYAYLYRVIRRDFGGVSVPKGLFQILRFYESRCSGPKNVGGRNLSSGDLFNWRR